MRIIVKIGKMYTMTNSKTKTRMSENVGKCRRMLENVGECRGMSGLIMSLNISQTKSKPKTQSNMRV